jgi:hypothetical protein
MACTTVKLEGLRALVDILRRGDMKWNPVLPLPAPSDRKPGSLSFRERVRMYAVYVYGSTLLGSVALV